MKNLRNFALAAFALLGFAACQQEEFAPEIKNPTHSVTFVAGAPETKTTVTIDGNTAKFAWTKDDESRFTVYENGIAASENETTGYLGEDGKMTIMATFEGEAPESPSYQALYNTAVKSTQKAYNLYDETSDVLVSDILNGSYREALSYPFRFKRESAIAKMTLKGLDEGVFVNSVTIESDKAIAGTYDLNSASFTSASNKITIETLSEITSKEATIWFASVPVEDATFTVTATAVDNNDNVVATYTKTFSNTITLTRGDVKGFRVAMNKLVDPHKKDNGWFLVKDARLLAAGDVIRIGCASAGKVAGALSSAILSSENATYKSEQMVSVSSAEDYTLGGTKGAWTLSSLTGKLGATAVKKLSINEAAQGYIGTWTISIDNDGAATIAPNVEGYGRILCNTNSGMEKFTTYKSDVQSNMLLPGIYKKYGTPAETKKDQSISFNPTSYTATIGKVNTYPTLTAQSSGAKTWTSSNTEVATINESTGEITLVAAGTTTIFVTVAGDDTYNEGTGSYELTVENAPVVSTATWSLVTDASKLAEGDVIVIVAAGSNVALSTTQNSNNRGQQAITKNANSTVTIDDKVQQLTLGAGNVEGTFSLSTGSGYLYAVSSSNNYLRTKTTLDNDGSWTITIDKSNNATITAQGTNTRNLLSYNSQSGLFSCYSSGQSDVQIYKLSGSSEGGGETGGGETDWSKTYTSNVTISGAKVIIGGKKYDAIQVGSSKSSGSKSFKVPANTTKLYLHVVGWNREGGKTHTIATSVGTISSSSIKTTADSGANNSSPFTLSSNDYSSSDYFYEFTLSGVTSEATITISNSAKESRGVYFGINAE